MELGVTFHNSWLENAESGSALIHGAVDVGISPLSKVDAGTGETTGINLGWDVGRVHGAEADKVWEWLDKASSSGSSGSRDPAGYQ